MTVEKIGDRRVAVVTGATGTIGLAIARQIAATPGHEVVLVCRDADKAVRCTEHITLATGNGGIRFKIVDLSCWSSIKALADSWKGPLHVLVNNAGVTPRHRECTREGIELQFATNVLGYFWMIEAFTKHLIRSAPARVINVASYWAGDLDVRDLEFKVRPYHNDAAYRQSKQANRMLTGAFATRLQSKGITVNACHPGDVNSTLSNNLGFGGHESPDEGARTPVWLATGESGGQVTGKYFERLREVRCPYVTDLVAAEALFRVCQGYVAQMHRLPT